MGFMPQVAQARAIDQQLSQRNTVSYSPAQGIDIDLQALLAATTDTTDTDGDGLPDSVEWVLGTDPDNPDSDFDTLEDYYEAANELDPLKADSNNDGLVDNLEIKDVAADFDGDSIPNIWDSDNDNDGVPDNLDTSPFASSSTSDCFHFDVKTNGNPTYVDFQIKPENDWHLKLQGATFDWPTDTEGQMQDRDSSLEDVKINPVLELTLNSRPEQSEVEDYSIIVPQDVSTTGGFVTHGTTIADINGNGYLDLILFGGDDAADPNRPGYIIGWDISYGVSDSMIAPSWWSPLKIQPRLDDYMGAGAVTDLNSNGRPEIYVPRVGDGFPSPIYYGVDLDNYGDQQRPGFSSSFSPLPIDYSFPSCIGSGLDIADIDGNGTPDILATVILEGTNELAYVIGWDLDNNRDISDPVFGRASAWSYSPSWYPNGGLPPIPQIGGNVTNVAVKITDVNANGTPDLLLMCTDSGADQLHYMIGWDLNTSGEPASWSEIKTSPQIGGAAAGGSAVAADLNRNGKLDLLLLAVDNAEKHNFHYVIGWDIDASGDPASWSSAQNYGDAYEGFVTHGTTIADINGNGYLDLILFGGDDAADPNRPGYIIGWDFDKSDSVIASSRWSPLKIQPNLGDYLGAGAVTDLNSNGKPEIYVPRVGGREVYLSPIYYGVDLDNHGDQQRPMFGSYFSPLNTGYLAPPNIGSGLDIADIDGNGTPDILATFILEGTNELAHTIGWDLDNSSEISYPWFGNTSAWSFSPNWYPNGGLPPIPQIDGNITNVAVKIADIDGNSKLDLLLMCTDSGADQLHYMIGWDLNTSGEPTGWSEIKTSPQIGGAVAGGSAVAADLNDNGKLDLLLLAVDNAEKHNFHYVIGWDIDATGDPASWSPIYNEQGTSHANRIYVPLTPVVDFGTNVAYSGRMFFPAGSTEELSIEARLVWMVTGKTDRVDEPSEDIMLAKYSEDFMLTGFAAYENYGTDAGLFYSDNRDQTIAAGFVLAYEFLRTQAPLSNMPEQIVNHGISRDSQTMNSQITSFPHQDAALVGLTSEMLTDAMDSFPEGHILPVLMALEDRFVNIELSQLVPVDGGSSYTADLRNAPVVTAKMFRMNWYDTTSKEIVELDTVFTEMQQWGLEPDVLESAMKTVVAWAAGDFTVTRIGSEEIPFVTPEKLEVLDTLGSVLDSGLAVIDITRASYGIYRYFTKIPQITGVSGSSLKGFVKGVVGACKEIQAVRVGAIGKVNTAIRCLSYAGDLLAIGIAFYSFFDVASRSGWSTLGMGLGMYYFDMILGYTLVIMAVASIPYVGWLLALGIVISDAIGGWFGDLVEAFLGLFYDTEIRSRVDVQLKDGSLNFDDYDDNGLDVGDRVDLIVDSVEKVWITNHGSQNDLANSWIHADLECNASNVSAQDADGVYIYRDTDGHQTYENVTIENLFWAEPSQAMVNFPWEIWITYDYRIWYNEIIFGSSERYSYRKSDRSDSFILYLDVLPGSINDFVAWGAITPLDLDGDGLWSNSGKDPNSEYYDTDWDGLSDGFEVLSDLNPSNADTDGDGLPDGVELHIGTEPLVTDTDEDGLSDGEEYQGWEISFTYCGQQFTAHVSSDPLLADTDGDGVGDKDESLKGFNPRSQDTNGDGIKDSSDDDSDGVPNKEEQGPDGTDSDYDGNGDGTPDSQQDNVASLHTHDGQYYVTIASPGGTTMTDVQAVDNPSPEDAPTNWDFPYGFFDFTINGVGSGGATTVTLHLPGDASVTTYYKYGPTPSDPTPHWYEFLYDGTTGAEISGNIITLHFVDGERGDNDLTANGTIVEPGGPGLPGATPIPPGPGGGGIAWPSSPAEPSPPEPPEEPVSTPAPTPPPAPAPAPGEPEDEGPSGLAPGAWAGIGIGAALLIALALWLILRRRLPAGG